MTWSLHCDKHKRERLASNIYSITEMGQRAFFIITLPPLISSSYEGLFLFKTIFYSSLVVS